MKFEQNIQRRLLSSKSASSKSSNTFHFNNNKNNINTLNKINTQINQNIIDTNDINNRKHHSQLYNKGNIYYLANEEATGDEDIDIIEVESNDFNDEDEDKDDDDDDDDLEVSDEQEEADINDLEDLLDDSDEKYFYTTTKVIINEKNVLYHISIEI